MKIHISRVGTSDGVVKINRVLQHEIKVGVIKSISSMPQKKAAFKISIVPSTSKEVVQAICHKMNKAGYSTRILPSNGYSHHSSSRVRRHNRVKNIPTINKNIIIAEKVFLPEQPSEPIELLPPNGDPPQNDKKGKDQR